MFFPSIKYKHAFTCVHNHLEELFGHVSEWRSEGVRGVFKKMEDSRKHNWSLSKLSGSNCISDIFKISFSKYQTKLVRISSSLVEHFFDVLSTYYVLLNSSFTDYPTIILTFL